MNRGSLAEPRRMFTPRRCIASLMDRQCSRNGRKPTGPDRLAYLRRRRWEFALELLVSRFYANDIVPRRKNLAVVWAARPGDEGHEVQRVLVDWAIYGLKRGLLVRQRVKQLINRVEPSRDVTRKMSRPAFTREASRFGSRFIEWDGHPNRRAYGIAAREIKIYLSMRADWRRDARVPAR